MFPQNRPPSHLQASAVASAVAASAAAASQQSLKLTYPETLDRIKEEFQFLQSQYHSLKMECEKLATEKTEIQRHYVMYYEMSYGLNIEMHKQVSPASLLPCTPATDPIMSLLIPVPCHSDCEWKCDNCMYLISFVTKYLIWLA
ncbi:transducin-like enhancer protein 1 [Ascaphus truei]|uniref:transducin-like enhancer protein 1 n=1 Tax=Ascaphus truei TaxID=8439 RepID=UPI003F5922CD